MSAPTTTELDCVHVVTGVFSTVASTVETWRDAVETWLHDADGPVRARDIDALIDPLAIPAVEPDSGLHIGGAGFVASPGFLSDARWHLSWWVRGAARGDRPPARPRRLVVVEDETSESFRDYTSLEWWRVPATTGRAHITGPYVDYVCTDDYTLTLTMPVRANGEIVGVVGADLYVDDLERMLLPAVRGAGVNAALVNTAGRVVVASDSHVPTGALLRIPDLAARAASRDTAPGPDGRRIVSCGDPSLVLVVGDAA